MDPPPPPAKSSGIPRLSRLPVPKSSQTSAPHPQKSSASTSALPSLRGGGSRPVPASATLKTSNIRSLQDSTLKSRAQRRVDSHPNRPLKDNDTQENFARGTNDPIPPNPLLSDDHGFSTQPTAEGEDAFSEEIPAPTPKARNPRPSLADRTMETLSKLPPTPGASRRRSGFFSPSSPTESSSRPTSSMSNRRPVSSMANRRPSTREGMHSFPRPASPTKKVNTPANPGNPKNMQTPSKRSVSSVETASSPSMKLSGTSAIASIKGPHHTPVKSTQLRAGPRFTGNHTVATRSPKPKPALGDVFKDEESSNSKEKSASPKGSAALREQIAKAKAARRAPPKTQNDQLDGQNDSGLQEDPFNQLPTNNEQVLNKRINVGRSEGRLNLAAMGLKAIPDAVLSMYDYNPDSNAAWSESVDLTRFIAADNEIEEFPDSFFPDIAVGDTANDEDGRGPQFGGLELLDMHRNVLHSVPSGLRRLERLTTLNLSHNKLQNNALDVITQVRSLHELNLAHNKFEGALSSSIGKLANLEVLELQDNRLSSIPDTIGELINIRVLHLAENNLSVLPLDAFMHLPLVDLSARKNKLDGALFPAHITSMPKLQRLDISSNGLTSLDSGELSLPSLQTLDISFNRITTLPDVSTWAELRSLLAEDNRISNLPEGLTSLQNMKNLDFTGNDLRHLDARIGLMDSLTILKVAANPIRERKFLSMNTDDVKQDLRMRIEPSPQQAKHEEAEEGLLGGSTATNSPSEHLALKTGGVLDLSNRSLSSLNDIFHSFPPAEDIRHLSLNHNALTSIPSELSLLPNLRILDLSHNRLSSSLLSTPLLLPHLHTLNLAANHLPSLTPLTTYLVAPTLTTLDLSSNRLTDTLPPLRASFPSLTHLLASDNQLSGTLHADALRGLRVANLSNNALEMLDPRIGLLWGVDGGVGAGVGGGGLRSLEVGGNRFRVPGWRVLERGTESVMAWLRDRIPEEGGRVVEEEEGREEV
ncbi:MAG: hypothetical protein Q9165_001238 [Trypethelium subeluteriae]